MLASTMQFSRFGRWPHRACAYRSAPAVRRGEVPKERKPVPSGPNSVLRRFTCNPRAFHAGKPAVLIR